MEICLRLNVTRIQTVDSKAISLNYGWKKLDGLEQDTDEGFLNPILCIRQQGSSLHEQAIRRHRCLGNPLNLCPQSELNHRLLRWGYIIYTWSETFKCLDRAVDTYRYNDLNSLGPTGHPICPSYSIPCNIGNRLSYVTRNSPRLYANCKNIRRTCIYRAYIYVSLVLPELLIHGVLYI